MKPTLLVPGSLANVKTDEVPIEYILNIIKRKMYEHTGNYPKTMSDRIFVIKSETGSGKSTALPSYIYRLVKSGVYCTQPRVLTAKELAENTVGGDNENYPDLIMGETIGYQTGSDNYLPRRGGLVYSTLGSVLKDFQRRLEDEDEEIEKRYKFIIIDEVHERSSPDTDYMLAIVKKYMFENLGRKNLPFIILTSATIDPNMYASYFGLKEENVIEVRGRTFPVDIKWPENGTNNYMKTAAETVMKLHEENAEDDPEQSDMLIFASGAADMDAIVSQLNKINNKYRRGNSKFLPFLVLKITSDVVRDETKDYILFKKSNSEILIPMIDGKSVNPMRKVIVSTNVAETGLTIDTLKYVIDCGWNFENITVHPEKYGGLVKTPITYDKLTQRKGRVGRKFPGEFYPLYTERISKHLPYKSLSGISRNINQIFLEIVGLFGGNSEGFRIENIDLLEQPPPDLLYSTLSTTLMFGFVERTENGYLLTELGKLAMGFAKLKENFSYVYLIFSAMLWRVSLRDIILIIALSRSTVKFFVKPPGLGKFNDSFISFIEAFDYFSEVLIKNENNITEVVEWCERNNIIFTDAIAIIKEREDIIDEIIGAGINPFWGEEYKLSNHKEKEDTVCRIKQCIYFAFRDKLLTRKDDKCYYDIYERKVSISHKFTEELSEPKYIVTDLIKLKQSGSFKGFAPVIYELKTNNISILDSYISPDLDLLEPR